MAWYILDFGDNSELSIANDSQPMPENAEEYLADLNWPATYYLWRRHTAGLKHYLAIPLYLLYHAHINGVSQ